MRKAADASLRRRGVDLVLGDFVDFSETSEVQGVTTRAGTAIKGADLLVSLRVTITDFVYDDLIVSFRYKHVDRGRTHSLSRHLSAQHHLGIAA